MASICRRWRPGATSSERWPSGADRAEREAVRHWRRRAAIALAIVSAKPEGHFLGSPGGYFHGMVAKARAGDLHLDRMLWGIRSGAATASPSRRSGPSPAFPRAS